MVQLMLFIGALNTDLFHLLPLGLNPIRANGSPQPFIQGAQAGLQTELIYTWPPEVWQDMAITLVTPAGRLVLRTKLLMVKEFYHCVFPSPAEMETSLLLEIAPFLPELRSVAFSLKSVSSYKLLSHPLNNFISMVSQMKAVATKPIV